LLGLSLLLLRLLPAELSAKKLLEEFIVKR
jgi:hypothetical protein